VFHQGKIDNWLPAEIYEHPVALVAGFVGVSIISGQVAQTITVAGNIFDPAENPPG
jgi:hypothetical protein